MGGKLWPYQTKLKKIEMASEQQSNKILILLRIFTYKYLVYIFLIILFLHIICQIVSINTFSWEKFTRLGMLCKLILQ